ncbi:MAG: flagellar motor protein MotB [Chitinispirillales bacterium]|jgi:chemotaxis protein MotB|nr:flagellar motor protein MotB [Chitinispirillales bacterium]
MPRGKKPEEQSKGAPLWMVTWADMVSLLLCFFVMLLALSSMDPAKFNAMANSFHSAFSGVMEAFPTVLVTRDIMIPRMGGDQQNKRMAIDAAAKVRRAVENENLEDAIRVQVTESGIAIKIADPIGFESGSADLRPEVQTVLRNIASIINESPTSLIRVEGHTDNIPISTARFPSNWELSSARALSVVRHMARTGGIDPARLSAIGYGEYRPIVPNTTAENRRTNRRIEIYVDYVQRRGSETGLFREL